MTPEKPLASHQTPQFMDADRTIKGGAFRGKAQARGHATAVRPRCATLATRAKLMSIYLIKKKLLKKLVRLQA